VLHQGFFIKYGEKRSQNSCDIIVNKNLLLKKRNIYSSIFSLCPTKMCLTFSGNK